MTCVCTDLELQLDLGHRDDCPRRREEYVRFRGLMLNNAPFRLGCDHGFQHSRVCLRLLSDYDTAVTGLLSGLQLGGTALAAAVKFAHRLDPVPDELLRSVK